MSISEELNKIKNAVYGREVRDAIHDGIKKAYDDASQGGNANMEVSLARGNFPTLSDRLNSVDSQLAQTAEQLAYTSQEVAKKANEDEVFLKSFGININDFDEPTRQTFLEAQGIDVNYVLGDRNVKPFNTTFFEKTSKNLFTGEYTVGWIDAVGEFVIDGTGNGRTAIIEIKPNKTYTIKVHEPEKQSRFSVAVKNTKPDLSLRRQPIDLVVRNHSLSEYTFTNTSSGRYLLIYVSGQDIGNAEPKMQVEEGELATNYVSGALKIPDKFIENPITKYTVNNPENIFDGEYLIGYILAWDSRGIYEFRQDPIYPDGVSIIVPIQPNKTYYIKKFDQSDRFRVATFDHKPISGSTPLRGFLNNDYSGMTFELTTESSEIYMVIQLSNSKEKPRVVINTSGYTDRYVSNTVIDSSYLPTIASQGNVGLTDRKFILSGKFDEYYKTEELEDLSSGDFVLQSSKIDDIYTRYDELVTDYPHLISRNHRGNGSNSSGNADSSLPIYEYVIEAPETTQETHTGGYDTTLSKAPLILISSGVHGNEKAAVWGVYQFVRQLLENLTNSEGLDDLKSNVSFKIIPIVNPGGYNANTRNNLRNVNINRNFSYRWNESNDSRKGSAPLSEIETRILNDWLIENQHAFAYIDYHNFTRTFTGRNIEMASYHFTPNKQLDIMYSSLIRRLSNKWRNKYFSNFADLGNIAFGFIHSGYYSGTPSTINQAYYVHGIKLSTTPEMTWHDVDGSSLNTKTVLETNTEMLVNYILSLVDNFKDGLQ